MSYALTTPGYYEQFQIGTALEEGAEGWTRAPWPGWGQNAALIGPKQIAVGASPDGLGAYLLAGFGPNPYVQAPLGAYYQDRPNQPIGATEGPGIWPLVFGVAAIGGVILIAGKMVGSKPKYRRNSHAARFWVYVKDRHLGWIREDHENENGLGYASEAAAQSHARYLEGFDGYPRATGTSRNEAVRKRSKRR